MLNAALAVADVVILPVAFLAAADSARRFEKGNPARRAWWLVSAGLAGFWVGEAVVGSYTVRGLESPFPSVADAFFLLAYPAILAALFLFLRAYRVSGYGEAGARTVLVTAIAVAVFGLPLLVPILRAPLPALERLVSGAYAAVDPVALLTFVGDVLVAYWLIAGTQGEDGSAEMLDTVSSVVFTLSYLAIARGTLHQRELLRG